LSQPAVFEYVAVNGTPQSISLSTGSLAFTVCQTPIIYHLGDRSKVQVHFSDGRVEEISGSRLENEISQHIFKRDGVIAKISVFLEKI